MSAPALLLPYQLRWINDLSPVAVWEKSRRIGASYGDASGSVLLAGVPKMQGGMNNFYISYNKEMTETYIRDCGDWSVKLGQAASQAEEALLEDEDDILSYRVRFASGNLIAALSSKPKNMRSKQGRIIIDEAAFCEDLDELLKAALAMVMWGGRVAIISTHNGDDNPFNELIREIRAGKWSYSLHRTTLDDALAEGLYQRICLVRGLEWSAGAEAAWRKDLIELYGDAADEELFCIPSKGSGSFLTRSLIEACANPAVPVLRWTPPAEDFVHWSEDQRYREVRDWCEVELGPVLAKLIPNLRSFLGEDFGRSGDLTVLWPLQEAENLTLLTPCVVELRNMPFKQQEQVLYFLGDRLPRFSGAALDARGNGQALAEYAMQRYGQDRISQVMLSESWYRENMPGFKAAFEDRTLTVPRDAAIMDDLRAFKMIRGVARLDDTRTGRGQERRHGDAGIAGALAVFAARRFEGGDPFSVAGIIPRQSVSLFRGY